MIAGRAPDGSAEHHFALEVAELEAARTRLAGNGWEIQAARRSAGGSGSSFATRSGT